MMDARRKAELLAKARKVLTRSEMEQYANFINNYEIVSARNDARLNKKYGQSTTL